MVMARSVILLLHYILRRGKSFQIVWLDYQAGSIATSDQALQLPVSLKPL